MSGFDRKKIIECIIYPLLIIGAVFLIIIIIMEFVIGIIYLSRCPINPMIPIYNLVAGSAGIFIILAFLILFGISKLQRCKHNPIVSAAVIVLILLAVFHIGWSIFGGYHTFRLQRNNSTQYEDPSLSTYCHPILYWITFALLIIYFVLLAAAGINIATIFSQSD